MKKYLLITLPVLALLLSACSLNINIDNDKSDSSKSEVGEVVAATPVATAKTATEPEVEEVEETKSDEEMIQQAMATKLTSMGANVDEINITVQTNTGAHASGSVSSKISEAGGGFFFAAKVDGEWIIAADGNGVIMCSDIEPYNFPASMIPECWDEVTNSSVER